MDWTNEFDTKTKEMKDNFIGSKRNLIRDLLNQCTEGQRELFNRMYQSIEELPEEKMRWAYHQVKSTVEKNNKH